MVFFRYRKGDRSIIPTLLGLQIIAWVTAGEQRSLFLFPACVLMSGTGGVLMTNGEKGKDHLYERYSERGARPSGKDSGNFFTYVQRAERIFGDTEEIRKPVKKHMAKIKRALKKPHN